MKVLEDYAMGCGAVFQKLDKTTIEDYDDITEKIEGFTRAVVWYTGHGLNLNNEVKRRGDNFPAFKGKNIYVEESKLLEEMTNLILKVVIFDCCNSASSKHQPTTNISVEDNISSLFDFRGWMTISSSKHNQFSYCFGDLGSEFTTYFLKNFDRTYVNTLKTISLYIHSSTIWEGELQYEKYSKRREENVKEKVVQERTHDDDLRSSLLARLLPTNVVESSRGTDIRGKGQGKDSPAPEQQS